MGLRIDDIAHDNSLRDFNPKLKILLLFILLTTILIINSPFISILILILNFFLTILIAKVPLKFYLKFISIPTTFSVFTCLFIMLFSGTGPIIYNMGFLIIIEDSLNLAITIFFRVLASFSTLGFLTMTNPINELFHVLYELKIPKIILEIAMLTYTTIFIFLDQITIMRNAQKSRLGYYGLKNSYKSTGILFSTLFFKSLDHSEKLQISLESRCFNGDFPVYKP